MCFPSIIRLLFLITLHLYRLICSAFCSGVRVLRFFFRIRLADLRVLLIVSAFNYKIRLVLYNNCWIIHRFSSAADILMFDFQAVIAMTL